MDATTFNRLEFPEVLEKLALHAQSSAAKQAVMATRPWTDVSEIGRHWDGVSEILELLDSGGDLPIDGFDDGRDLLTRLAKPDGVLSAAEWMTLRRLITISSAVRRRVQSRCEQMPTCWIQLEPVDPLKSLCAELARVFDEDGLVRDNASPDLRACRSQIRRLQRKIEGSLERIFSKLRESDVLRGDYSTLRSGRRVLPVRAGARGRVPGIVHDVSNTGETLFIEPLEVVELANRLTEEENREREEVRRVLRELANSARADLPSLELNRDALLQIDLWHARARLAYLHALHRPRIDPELTLDLIETHHPLLYFLDRERSVALNLRLDPQDRVLTITGPNTGGKTTCLKTVGLIALMAQSAIPVPVGVDSRLPVFDQILAEVGDEQSVSAGLSTFSAHIRRISWILEHCGKNALVLLDELGKATDPIQAGALGRAILEALIDRKALTLVSTHLATLKDWSHDCSAARNASFRLDPCSHQPLYQIHLDTPGISEAFTIARAEGLPREIVDAAIERMPRDERELTELLHSLHTKEALLERDLRRTRSSRKEAERVKKEWRARLGEIQQEKVGHDKRLEKEYKKLLDNARVDIEKRIANLPSRQAISEARNRLVRDQKATEERLAALEQRERRILEGAQVPDFEENDEPYEPAAGDWVFMGKGDQVGQVDRIEVERGRALISAGSIDFEVRAKDLRPAPPPEPDRPMRTGFRYAGGVSSQTVSPEIDLHGQRVEDAQILADKYLDDAVLAHLTQVRIIHGYGTGALRNGLHEFLRHHPHVRSFRLADPQEGGRAVTIVSLK